MAIFSKFNGVRKLTNSSISSIIDVSNLNFKDISDANIEFLTNIGYDESLNSILSLNDLTSQTLHIENRFSMMLNGSETWSIDSQGRAEGKSFLVEVAEAKRYRYTDFPDWPDVGVPGEIVYTGIQNQKPEFGEDFIGYLDGRGWVSLTGANPLNPLTLIDNGNNVQPAPNTGFGIVWIGAPGLSTANTPVNQDLYFTDDNGNIFSLTSGSGSGADSDWITENVNDLRQGLNGNLLPFANLNNNIGTYSNVWNAIHVNDIKFDSITGYKISFNGSLKSIDILSNNSGVGFISLEAANDITLNGQNIILNGVLTVDQNSLRYSDGSENAGYVLTSDAFGNASWQPAPSGGGGGGTTNYAYTTIIDVVANTPYTINHNLNTEYIQVSAVELPSEVEADVVLNNYTTTSVDIISTYDAKFRITILAAGGTSGGSTTVAVDNITVQYNANNELTSTILSINDKNIPSLATSNDEDPATLTGITDVPVPGSYVSFKYNGVDYEVGNGVKTAPVYFSADGGLTAKTFDTIAQGDIPYWNGSIAGFQLKAGDRISFEYLTYLPVTS